MLVSDDYLELVVCGDEEFRIMQHCVPEGLVQVYTSIDGKHCDALGDDVSDAIANLKLKIASALDVHVMDLVTKRVRIDVGDFESDRISDNDSYGVRSIHRFFRGRVHRNLLLDDSKYYSFDSARRAAIWSSMDSKVAFAEVLDWRKIIGFRVIEAYVRGERVK